jgi:hypothetical protein
MKKSLVIAAGLSALVVGGAGAQTTCRGGSPANADSVTANARMQARDLFQYLAPQIAQSLVGGNVTLGQTSTVGGLGHFSLGVKGTVLAGSVPDVGNFPQCYTNAQNSTPLPTKSQVLGLPSADAAIGIFGGLPLALTNVGGVDLLVSASYIPEVSPGGVRVRTPDGSLQLGYGARLGLLSESILVPGVSLSYMKRDLPRVNVFANTNNDTLAVTGLKVKTTAWRLTASKSLIFFGIAAGVGQDKFKSNVDTIRANVAVPAGTVGGVAVPVGTRYNTAVVGPSQELTRTNYFLNVSLNMLLAKLTAEVGQSTGGTVSTFNSFSGSQPAGARTYGSLGLRFGL